MPIEDSHRGGIPRIDTSSQMRYRSSRVEFRSSIDHRSTVLAASDVKTSPSGRIPSPLNGLQLADGKPVCPVRMRSQKDIGGMAVGRVVLDANPEVVGRLLILADRVEELLDGHEVRRIWIGFRKPCGASGVRHLGHHPFPHGHCGRFDAITEPGPWFVVKAVLDNSQARLVREPVLDRIS